MARLGVLAQALKQLSGKILNLQTRMELGEIVQDSSHLSTTLFKTNIISTISSFYPFWARMEKIVRCNSCSCSRIHRMTAWCHPLSKLTSSNARHTGPDAYLDSIYIASSRPMSTHRAILSYGCVEPGLGGSMGLGGLVVAQARVTPVATTLGARALSRATGESYM